MIPSKKTARLPVVEVGYRRVLLEDQEIYKKNVGQ